MWYVSFYPWVILDIVEESLDKVAANKASSTCHKDCNTTLFPIAVSLCAMPPLEWGYVSYWYWEEMLHQTFDFFLGHARRFHDTINGGAN